MDTSRLVNYHQKEYFKLFYLLTYMVIYHVFISKFCILESVTINEFIMYVFSYCVPGYILENNCLQYIHSRMNYIRMVPLYYIFWAFL